MTALDFQVASRVDAHHGRRSPPPPLYLTTIPKAEMTTMSILLTTTRAMEAAMVLRVIVMQLHVMTRRKVQVAMSCER